jgi:hypothetical protein
MENRLLWRQNRRRLEAEAIRDAMVYVTGRMDLKLGGPNIRPGTAVERDYKFDDVRRSVYTPVFRNHLHELFAVFDFPDPNLVAGRRAVSTVAPQALYLLNSPLVMEQAQHAAKKALAEPNLSDAERIDRAYRAALGRLPGERERQIALAYLREAGNGATQRQTTWEQFYQVLFSSIDFRYVN